MIENETDYNVKSSLLARFFLFSPVKETVDFFLFTAYFAMNRQHNHRFFEIFGTLTSLSFILYHF
jgi:hypothetical protein